MKCHRKTFDGIKFKKKRKAEKKFRDTILRLLRNNRNNINTHRDRQKVRDRKHTIQCHTIRMVISISSKYNKHAKEIAPI